MNNKAYVIMQGEYSDRHVVKVCLDEKLAERICELHNKVTASSCYYIEEYDISHEPDHEWVELSYIIDFYEDGQIKYEYATPDDIWDEDILTDTYKPYERTVASSVAYDPVLYTVAYTRTVPVEQFSDERLDVYANLKRRAHEMLQKIQDDAVVMLQLKQGSRVTYLETEDL